MENSDPRVYFAAERTLLAWVRTGIAVMAFGFVVARFASVLSLVRAPQDDGYSTRLSPLIGAALVVIGSAAIAAGTFEFRRYCNRLRPEEFPSVHATLLPETLAWLIAALGIALVFVVVT